MAVKKFARIRAELSEQRESLSFLFLDSTDPSDELEALEANMHVRSPYAKAPPDFAQLAKDYPGFAKYVTRNSSQSPSIDFQDPDAVRTLSEALLWKDFGIAASFADDRLCPTIPNRLNYVLWLQDVLTETRRILALAKPEVSSADAHANIGEDGRRRKKARLSQEPTDKLKGLDIGTGASVIYPLLFCATDPDVQMTGTDIDSRSLEHAQSIIQDPRNVAHRLSSRIRLTLKQPPDPFFELPSISDWASVNHGIGFNFTMCNPPFYSSRQEMSDSARRKAKGASAVCTGTDGEMVFEVDGPQDEGGEFGFVKRMIDESFQLGHRADILWFTSMLGRLSSVDALLDHLRRKNQEGDQNSHGHDEKNEKPLSWVVQELIQGNTKRWVLGWSFAGVHLADQPLTVPRHGRPWTTKQNWLSGTGSVDAALRGIEEALRSIDNLTYERRSDELNDEAVTIQVAITAVSWTRTARRAKARGGGQDSSNSGTGTAVLCVDILIEARSDMPVDAETAPETETQAANVDMRWTFGRSQAIFDSFCQHLKSKWVAQRHK